MKSRAVLTRVHLLSVVSLLLILTVNRTSAQKLFRSNRAFWMCVFEFSIAYLWTQNVPDYETASLIIICVCGGHRGRFSC